MFFHATGLSGKLGGTFTSLWRFLAQEYPPMELGGLWVASLATGFLYSYFYIELLASLLTTVIRPVCVCARSWLVPLAHSGGCCREVTVFSRLCFLLSYASLGWGNPAELKLRLGDSGQWGHLYVSLCDETCHPFCQEIKAELPKSRLWLAHIGRHSSC